MSRGADTRALELLWHILQEPEPTGKDNPMVDVRQPLSGREREVMARVAAGKANKDIAGEMFVSVETVKSHLRRIFMKLGVDSRAAAATVWSLRPEVVITGVRVRVADREEMWFVPAAEPPMS